MPSQIDMASKGAPNGRPRYFIGKEETLQSKMRAKPSALLTLPTWTNSDLARLIFKPDDFKTQKQAMQITKVIRVCLEKNQSAIREQKMGDVKPSNIPRPHGES
jgi:hypothetical protein